MERHANGHVPRLRPADTAPGGAVIPRWVQRGQPHDGEVDEVVVQRAVRGEWPAAELHPADRLATVAELWRLGYGLVDSARVLWTTKRAVEADRQHLRYRARREGNAA